MAKKFISDSVFDSRAAALAALAEAHRNMTAAGIADPWALTLDTLPTVTDDEGNTVSTLSMDGEGLPLITTDDKIGTLALVTVWHDAAQSIPQASGEPLAVPKAVYFLALPDFAEIVGSDKLKDYASALIKRDLLAKARKIAKAHDADADAAPLVRDRIAALIAATASRAGDPAAKAFKALSGVLTAAIVTHVEKHAAALKANGRHADARMLLATYSRSRLNADTLQQCLMSEEAAKRHFPLMAQTQWENLLKFAISWAPKNRVSKIVKNPDGTNAKHIDPATGKETFIREEVAAPVSPVPFMAWLETRKERTLAPSEAPTVDFSDLLAG